MALFPATELGLKETETVWAQTDAKSIVFWVAHGGLAKLSKILVGPLLKLV